MVVNMDKQLFSLKKIPPPNKKKIKKKERTVTEERPIFFSERIIANK